jgi:hypothetical protein
MVTLATRCELVLFTVKAAEIVPFPDPEGVTVHHDWSLPAVHDELEVTVNVVEPAPGNTFRFVGVTERVGASWVTVTTTAGSPLTVTVILATRCALVLFTV